jgi:ABC-type glutathione transport system ATPase component
MTESPHGNTPGSDRDACTSGAGSSRESALTMGSITKTFRSGHLGKRTVTDALRDVSIEVSGGQVMGLVGESGSGKSTLGRIALGLTSPTAGTVQCVGKEITELHSGELRRHRRRMQMIFQDSGSAFNPRMTLEDLLVEPLKVQGIDSPADRRRKASKIADEVGLRSEWMGRLPHEFSGGQRQRISIARALILEPEFVVADEPVSALDVSIQAQVLNLLKDIQEARNLSMLFISHDLAVVDFIADDVTVLYHGEVVERGTSAAIMDSPQHDYTRTLVAASKFDD